MLNLHRALPARYRIAATIAAGCGLRQGELFGLAVDDVEFLGRTLHVVRQMKLVRGKPIFALPKGRKTRDIPLPETVATELAAHIAAFPPLGISLPRETPNGEPTTARLLLYARERRALDRHHLRTYTHLLPTSEQRTRQAVDRALTGGAATADGLPTAQGPN